MRGRDRRMLVEGEMTNGHTKQPRNIMLQLEILVRKSLGAVDTRAPCAVAVEEISALNHEILDLRENESAKTF